MRLILNIFFLLCNITAFSFKQVNDPALNIDSAEQYNITKHLQFYSFGDKQVNVSQAFQFYTAGKFQPVLPTNNGFINDGLISSEKWFALPLENNTNKEQTLVLEQVLSGVNEIEYFYINETDEINLVSSPQNSNETEQIGLLSKSVTANITLGTAEKKLLLIHTVNKGQLFYFPAYIYSANHFRERDVYRNNFFGIFQGIFFFIIFFNLIIFITTLESIYLFYAVYAFCISIFALNDAGTATYQFDIFKSIQFLPGQSFLLIGFSAWLLLMKLFINVTKKNVTANRLLLALAILDFLFAILPLFFNQLSPVSLKLFQEGYQVCVQLLYLTNIIFIIVTNVSRVSNKNKLAIFYALANIPVMLGTLIYYTNYYDITNIQFGWLNPVALGLSIETFVLAFGFAYRYNLIGKEKNQLLVQLNKQLEDVTKQIIQTQESERKRIASDLHDQLGGDLAAIKLSLQKLPVEKKFYSPIINMIDAASADVRNISHNLMPPEFEQTALDNLLSNFYKQLNTEHTIKFHFHSSGSDHHFTKQDELMLYRIILELTNNIIKHSNAAEATIQLVYYDAYLELMAEDNGQGFFAGTADGMGLKNINARVYYLKGNITVDTSTHGTTIMINIPYENIQPGN